MFVKYQQDQQFLLPPSLEELLPKDHLARVISEIVDKLNLAKINERYAHLGRPAYHPKMLIKILFFGYASGVRSSRRIAKALETDIAFMWLSAMNRPDFRTISDFRKNNRIAMGELFSQIVATCISSGMATVGKVAVDGTKIKANASKRSIRDELGHMLKEIDQKMKEMLDEADQIDREEDELYGDARGDELPKELQSKETRKKKIEEALDRINKDRNKDGSKKKLSITDTDSSLMKTTNGIMPAYNAQAVSSKEGLILAADVSSNGFDSYQLEPMVNKLEKNTSEKPSVLLADAGYYSGKALEFVEKENIDAYIPILENLDRNKARGRLKNNQYDYFQKEEFKYDAEKDCYVCPIGKELNFYKLGKKINNSTYRRYICKNKDCTSRQLCTRSKRGRTVDRISHEHLYTKMREKMGTDHAKEIYRKRQAIIEPIFSIIKGPLNFDKFYTRGIDQVRSEWMLACCAFNILKIWRIQQKIVNIGTI